jgi:N-formylglutamate deformylase
VVSIPHTGVEVPPVIADRFANDEIASLPMTDWHLHHLYDFLPALGFTTIHANYSRFVIDLNRAPKAQSLYPGRFETGLVASKTFQGEPIWKSNPAAAEIEQRRADYHQPYHEKLMALLEEKIGRFGRAFLIDAHSVISTANKLHGELKAEIYLGDRDGQSCQPAMIEFFADAFSQAGLAVSRNDPYKGGYITAHYGQMDSVQALQIEMCQRVYMDEADPVGGPDHPGFNSIKQQLKQGFSNFSGFVAERGDTRG